MAQHNEIGIIGENIAEKYYSEQGYALLAQNYRKKYGEIDLIVQKARKVFFVEVKSVSYETMALFEKSVSYETFKPEDHFTPEKLKKLDKTLQTWILNEKYTGSWQLDLLTVRIVPCETFAAVERFENVHFE